jgi:hypothetical protein
MTIESLVFITSNCKISALVVTIVESQVVHMII